MSSIGPGPQHPQPYGGQGGPLYPYQPMPQPPRHWFRTFAFSMLMLLIPFFGSYFSLIYIYDRDEPHRFSIGRAFVASLIQFLYMVIVVAAVFAVLMATGLLGSMLDQTQAGR